MHVKAYLMVHCRERERGSRRRRRRGRGRKKTREREREGEKERDFFFYTNHLLSAQKKEDLVTSFHFFIHERCLAN